ncbi:hypothetical protein TNIN_198501 [Trichonephila inaurata madagascariensis]|uniref:Uncharacterized protein n=1 Tax=Trichonephila inaurata madagascariensis TaxID=2747483 RepID=A0A8X7CUY2_9ARAC|nr:hypothetical protein TNIN_198501 [Trichonephila inaurata madagascariensis]
MDSQMWTLELCLLLSGAAFVGDKEMSGELRHTCRQKLSPEVTFSQRQELRTKHTQQYTKMTHASRHYRQGRKKHTLEHQDEETDRRGQQKAERQTSGGDAAHPRTSHGEDRDGFALKIMVLRRDERHSSAAVAGSKEDLGKWMSQ